MSYLSSDAAIAALQDEKFIDQSVLANTEQREYLYKELKKSGYNTIPTQANFIYLWFNNDKEKKKVFDMLFQNGILFAT